MIEYWQMNSSEMLQEVAQHAQMVLTSLVIALLVAMVIVLVFLRRQNWLNGLVYFFSLLYSIPSFAFFALLLRSRGWV